MITNRATINAKKANAAKRAIKATRVKKANAGIKAAKVILG